MKKFFLIAMTCVIGLALVLPAWAVESEFGGYWRTRAYSQQDFDGNDSGTYSTVDTRTRIYYTAILHENLKLVNKFEFDPIWGDDDTGDIGADGKDEIFELKNSYADFNLGEHNFKVGIHGAKMARGILLDTDWSGITATFNLGSMTLPVMWAKASDRDLGTNAKIPNRNLDYVGLNPVFNLSETMSVNPYLLYIKEQGTETSGFYLGADVDTKVQDMDLWCTAIIESGEYLGDDVFGFLVAAGADAGMVHGQFFYASGDDDPNDNDINTFTPPAGRSYYWAEILGYGMFGDTGAIEGYLSAAAPRDELSNVMALNIGATIKPMDKLTLTGDIWYAMLAEEVAGEDELGVEVDLKASYALLDNLSLNVVAAYLMAGDVIGDEDPIEIGTMLSLSF